MNTSCVVISRETERFVNEIHDHKEELRSSNGLLTDLQGSQRSELHGEDRGTNGIKETCAPRSIKETCASPLSTPPTKASLYTKRTILTMRGSGMLSMPIHQTEETWQLQSPNWLQNGASS